MLLQPFSDTVTAPLVLLAALPAVVEASPFKPPVA